MVAFFDAVDDQSAGDGLVGAGRQGEADFATFASSDPFPGVGIAGIPHGCPGVFRGRRLWPGSMLGFW